MRPIKVFVYGFEPFDQYATNITQQILLALRGKETDPAYILKYHVFKVEFNQEMFLEKLNRLKPDFILGLGQHSRAKKLRIERKAVNWMSAERAKVGMKGGKKIENSSTNALYLAASTSR